MKASLNEVTSRRSPIRLWLACLAVCGLMALPLLVATAAGTGTVVGTVDLGSGPIENAAVILRCAEDSSAEHSTATDAAGQFEVTDVPLGNISVLVYDTNEQLIAQGEAVLVNAGETVTVTLHSPNP